MYKISLIIPIYNTAPTFENTFQSIKNQSIGFENIELIYVDDCSTDNSKEIIQEKIKSYDNVKYYRTEQNSGFPSRPRNIGINNSSSKYIMFLDQDDVFFENACEVLYNLIETEDADIVSGNYIETINSKSSLLDWSMVNIAENEIISIDSVDKNKNLLRLNPSIWTKIYKKSFLIENEIFFVNEILIEDVIFVSECLLESNHIIFINIPIVNYLIRSHEGKSEDEGSLSIAKNKKVLYALLKGIKIFNKMLKQYHHEYHWLAVRHLNFWMTQFVESNLSRVEKLEILTYAYDLFKDYNRFERTQPIPKYKLIFEKIIKKDFDDAIKLSEYHDALNKPLSKTNQINKKNILLIVKDFEKNPLKEVLYKLGKTLNMTIFDVGPFNLNHINNISSNNQDNLKILNLFEYFFNKEEFTNNLNTTEKSFKEEQLPNNKYILIKENFNNYELINYYAKDSNNSENSTSDLDGKPLFKKQYLIHNKLLYEVEFKNKKIIHEKFYNNTGDNYLCILHDEKIYEFKNPQNDTQFILNSYNELIEYVLLDCFLKLSPDYVLNIENNLINIIEKIKPKPMISIHYLNNYTQINDIKFLKEYSIIKENNYIITSDNITLNKINEEFKFDNVITLKQDTSENQVIHWINCLNKINIEKELYFSNNNIEFENWNINNNLDNHDLDQMNHEELINIIKKQNSNIIGLKENLISLISKDN